MPKTLFSAKSARLSEESDRVFAPRPNVEFELNGARWIDFYALLSIEPSATSPEIEEAIISCSADLLLCDVGRNATPQTLLIRRTIHDFRPVLLDHARRARYDALLVAHRNRDESAPKYETWRQEELGFHLARVLKQHSLSWWSRVRQNARETPYW